ncbi:LOW QUALITY PROTEIN: signal peptide peptidase-like 2B [Daphnia magna]|uniref:LOW QUALITY PROTEIN: signal peptide peptidase-like 2B n=1 Tax=Daphnia magna TaxID=35525 RepID=UPI001E1BD72B|nr:LOW QUALITY PROTEIN: signal peptide peptidase-like 2B [Daphnia magna]
MAACCNRFVDVVFLVFVSLTCCQATYLSFSYGVLEAKNGTTEGSFCVIYYPNITSYPSEKAEATYEPIIDLSLWDGCSETPPNSEDISDKFVITSNGNCSIVTKAETIKRFKGKGLLIVTAQVMHLPDNISYPVSIPVALIGQGSKDILVGLGNSIQIFIYSPIDGSHMDYSLLVIWSLAVLTVGIGAYWSGLVRYDLQKQSHLISQGHPGEVSEETKAILQEEVSLSVTPVLVGVFVLCMCGMLLLLYFFFSYLVYVIIGLFVLASTTAVYQCLEPIVRRIPVGAVKLPRCNIGFVRVHVEARQLVLFIGAVALAACWVVYRKEKFSWILQDILGFAFSVNMIRQVRLPSLKICTLLLVLLFFYDIFFVFITPLFTKNGQSVMVEVATGGGSGVSGGTGGNSGGSSSGGDEQLPMVIRVPHLGYDPLSVCWQRYSLLGFGDILVPGMLVGFCHGFDLATANRRKLYYISTLIAYGLGLMVTFVGLYLMAVAQPALLYLVPFTLIPVFLLGLCRRELSLLWNGDGQVVENTRLTDSSKLESARPELDLDKESLPERASSKDRTALMD